MMRIIFIAIFLGGCGTVSDCRNTMGLEGPPQVRPGYRLSGHGGSFVVIKRNTVLSKTIGATTFSLELLACSDGMAQLKLVFPTEQRQITGMLQQGDVISIGLTAILFEMNIRAVNSDDVELYLVATTYAHADK